MPPPTERARATVLAALTTEATSTSDLYDRIGYPALMRAGLIDYRAFRSTLEALEADKLAHSASGDDETGTLWRIQSAPEGAR
jgi:hypothetical protein